MPGRGRSLQPHCLADNRGRSVSSTERKGEGEMGKTADLVRKAAEAFAAGDMDTLLPLLADDFTLHVPGNNQLSGTYKGMDEFFSFVGKLMELTGGQVSLKVHD